MSSLQGKRALVTGAGHGIGAAIAAGLLDAGCDVAVHYHHHDDDVLHLVDHAQSLGRRVHAFPADLADELQCSAGVSAAVDFLGGLEVLVNNAGGLVERRVLEQVERGFWQTVFDLNLTTMMLVTRQAVGALAAAGASSIVNVASLAGRKGGHPGSLVYSTAKGAVLTWTRSLATELAPRGIRVNAVAPGLILGTRFHNTHTTPDSASATVKTIPLGRAGNAHDVARAVVFLASEYDGFVTGATLDINGGVYCA